jgi:hypothetical protein
LIANAFTANRPLKVVRRAGDPKPIKDPIAPKWTRPVDTVSHLHAIITFIMATSQRIEQFQAINKVYIEEDFLRPVRDNNTSWFSVYLMLIRAIKIKDSIDVFVARYIIAARGEKDLSDHIMRQDDWAYYTDIIAFMVPLYDFVKKLEGKSQSGGNNYAHEVLPAYILMQEHIDSQLQAFATHDQDIEYNQDPLWNTQKDRFQTNIKNTSAKLLKYR